MIVTNAHKRIRNNSRSTRIFFVLKKITRLWDESYVAFDGFSQIPMTITDVHLKRILKLNILCIISPLRFEFYVHGD